MSQDALPSTAAGEPRPPFRAVLTPYRSLSRAGFIVLMATVAVVSFVAGTAFLLAGAWPVLGFFGLDVLIIYLAFRANYIAAREHETIEIDGGRLVLTQTDRRGRSRTVELNPYWASVRLSEAVDGRTRLALASHGREHVLGRFLTDDERRDLAGALRGALATARGPRI